MIYNSRLNWNHHQSFILTILTTLGELTPRAIKQSGDLARRGCTSISEQDSRHEGDHRGVPVGGARRAGGHRGGRARLLARRRPHRAAGTGHQQPGWALATHHAARRLHTACVCGSCAEATGYWLIITILPTFQNETIDRVNKIRFAVSWEYSGFFFLLLQVNKIWLPICPK